MAGFATVGAGMGWLDYHEGEAAADQGAVSFATGSGQKGDFKAATTKFDIVKAAGMVIAGAVTGWAMDFHEGGPQGAPSGQKRPGIGS